MRALVGREYMINRSYRLTLPLDIFFGFLNLIIFFFISKTFHGGASAGLAGAPDYFAFASVGIALGLVIQTASVRIAHRMREEQLTGTLEALVAQPIRGSELSIGLAGFDVVFAMARATLYILVAWLFLGVDLSRASWLGFSLVLLCAGTAMAAIGIVLAAGVLVFKRAELAGLMVTLALSTLGGAAFPVRVLPDWLDPIVRVVPTRFAFDGVRHALFRGTGWSGDAGALLLISAVSLPVAFLVFNGALELAKRRGSLATY